mmetsp:Transcript_17722/g.23453  ORF Transcript_17722/g.23453 Transcript_17722/m.23453 type:complete len:252 (-) Transcript_17722:132-887(-)
MASVIARTTLVTSARQRSVIAALSSSSTSSASCLGWKSSTVASTSPRIITSPQVEVVQRRNLSSATGGEEKPGFFDRMRDKLSDREQKKQADKYAEQLQKMASVDSWTLKAFSDEISQSLSSWRMKIPGMSNVQQVKAVKEQQKIIEAIKVEVGENGTAADITALGRKEKLKISLRSDVSIQDMNMLIKQFQSMDVMHKVLRQRKLAGKDIPTDEQGVKALIHKEGKTALTREQKQTMKKARSKSAMRGMR